MNNLSKDVQIGSKYEKANPTVAILMTVRDEESYIDLNISYHLDLGFDYIFITDHCSVDNTRQILDSYKNNPRVIVIKDDDPIFDHAKIANNLLRYAKTNYEVDWFIFLDVDEFLSIKEKNIKCFVNRLEKNDIPYATIGWANALFDYTFSDYTCSPTNPVDTTKYYYPWPEREWQEYGHFRKAIVKNHDNMEIVVGGHYVETGNNKGFFGKYHWNPFITPKGEAIILHFEFRGKADEIYKKWEKLASFENDSTSDLDSPWMERIQTIRKYVEDFKDNIEEINKRWFSEHRTFWGTIIPADRVTYDNSLSIWYGRYFRKKVDSGEIKSVCLVRGGHLGDVVISEPVARFLSKHLDRVCLATKIKEAKSIFKPDTYTQFYDYSRVISGEIDCDATIKLVYEFSDNTRSYIQGYMESIGYGDVLVEDVPILNGDWDEIIEGEYILISPFTSHWEEKKRSWGYDKFVELSKLLGKEYQVKCVFLEKHHSFYEMMSLIRHCKFIVGNDSGPCVIAQSFDKTSFILFGATDPKYLHMSEFMVPLRDKNRHKLCTHHLRQEEIDCCEEFCMNRLRVIDVFDQIKDGYARIKTKN